MLHAVLNATKVPKRGAPRKSFVVTFGVVAGPSKTQVTPAESQSEKGKQKAQDTDLGDELGRWDVIVRREVAGKPVTVFDVRWVSHTNFPADLVALMASCCRMDVRI